MEEALNFAKLGKIKTEYHVVSLNEINEVFEKMKKGQITGRIVMKL